MSPTTFSAVALGLHTHTHHHKSFLSHTQSGELKFKQLISHYICEHALSFLQRHSFLLPDIVSHLSLLTDFMVYCYELAQSAQVTTFHGGKITAFLKTMSK